LVKVVLPSANIANIELRGNGLETTARASSKVRSAHGFGSSTPPLTDLLQEVCHAVVVSDEIALDGAVSGGITPTNLARPGIGAVLDDR
jgi:hypothetical protein